MTRFAVLGMGRMGTAMARRLLWSGAAVTVWNRTRRRAEPLARDGATLAGTAADAVSAADVVITMVADEAALTETLFGPDGAAAALPSNALLVQMSTIGPQATGRIADRAAGIRLVDCPVKGSTPAVDAGRLELLASGDSADVDAATDALAPLGSVRRCGALGAGSAAKLVVNAAMIGPVGLLAEVFAVADAMGVSGALSRDLLADSPLGPALARAEQSGARFPIAMAAKDVRLAASQTDDTALLRGVEEKLARIDDPGRDLGAAVTDIHPL